MLASPVRPGEGSTAPRGNGGIRASRRGTLVRGTVRPWRDRPAARRSGLRRTTAPVVRGTRRAEGDLRPVGGATRGRGAARRRRRSAPAPAARKDASGQAADLPGQREVGAGQAAGQCVDRVSVTLFQEMAMSG